MDRDCAGRDASVMMEVVVHGPGGSSKVLVEAPDLFRDPGRFDEDASSLIRSALCLEKKRTCVRTSTRMRGISA